MSSTVLRTFRQARGLLPLVPLLLLGTPASQAQAPPSSAPLTQPISPSAGLPTITALFNHTSVVSLAGTKYDFNYYDFSITGFTNVGAGNPAYDIFSFSNSTLEEEPGVVAVASSYLPQGWTFDDSQDFKISTTPASVIHADDPQFGLIFIQDLTTAPINPTDAPFEMFHQVNGVDPFTLNGKPVIVLVNNPVPEASTTASFGLLLLLGLGGVAVATRRRKGAREASASAL